MEQPVLTIADLNALAAAARAQEKSGPAWSLASSDLNLNLVRLPPGDEIPGHINAEVDVVYLAVAGAGTIELGYAGGSMETHAMAPGGLFVVPKGLHRAIHAGEQGLVYLTCHRRRAGLMPRRAHKPHASDE
ncbi:MAG TPA: cupin domain-containing protein [Ktedonobacterales bacterium]